MHLESSKNFSIRIATFTAILFLFTALIVLRLFVISVGEHAYYSAQASSQHGYYQKLIPARGEIFVSDHFSDKPYPVATDIKKDLVYAVPKEIADAQKTAQVLAQIISLPAADIYTRLSDTSRAYVPIKKLLSDQESKAINEAKLQGIFLDQESVRTYPQGNFLSQVLGFIGFKDASDQKVGLYGLEKYFEKDLAGVPGEISTEADKQGAWIVGSQRNFTPAVDGTSLQLTIDRAIQFKAETVLDDVVQKHGADGGAIIIADPKTGAILAMASAPGFDPNEYNKAKDPSVYLNMATTFNYEPGSIMKSLTLSSALDAGLITPTTTYNDTGVVDIAGYKIKNSDLKAHGVVPMTTVLDESLNTGAIWVEQQLGNQRFLDYLKKFGLGQATNVELPETTGDLNTLKGNVQINYYTAAFGQGITVTPIQMLQAYIPMANGGKLMQPYIVAAKILPDGTVEKTEPKVLRQVLSAQASSLISAMLVDVVENGHGKKAAVKGYYIGGKTGTAQVVENGVYVQNDNNGSFIGYGPVNDPKFVMIVFIKRPRDVKFAETTAAPAFGQLAQFMLNYYNVPTTR